MNKSKLQRVFAVILVVALLTSTFGTAAFAAEQAVVLQQASGTELTATLPGGQFAKIYLGLTPKEPGTVTVRAEWDRENPSQNGVGFYVLDEADLTAVVNGGSVQQNNLGVGDPNFFQGAPGNVQGAGFNATASNYALVLYNDSAADGNVKLSVTNAVISDDSGNVTFTAGTPTAEATEAAAEEATAAATAAATAVATATPAATAEATATPAAAATTAGPVRATTMEGELPERDTQHFLALEPDTRDAEIRLTLTFDPQDNSELARRLGFWVLTQEGLRRYNEGESVMDVAIASGTRDSVTGGAPNVRSAAFTASGSDPYTVIVYNNSNIPATYSLVSRGGMLVDDSGQTTTAQQAGAVTATGATTSTTTAETTAATTTTTAAATPAAGSGVVGEPGGTYTVKAGDTLAIIARDIYGDYRLYEQLCAFNNIADCNVIEIGDVINLPTTAQIGATSTAVAAATPAATAAATPVATAVATTTAVTTTTAATTTAAATTTTTTAAAATTATTTTTSAAATPAATTAAAAASGSTIAQVAANSGNFTILTQALKQAGLDTTLGGAGNFTVFAPTDDAFNALLSSNNLTTDQLLRAAELADILRYHVLNEKLLAADITNGLSTTTLEGKPVTFEIKNGKVYINGAEIVTTDIPASNGVIHAISAVILPPQ